jgi:SAM-dependent methyltransferase
LRNRTNSPRIRVERAHERFSPRSRDAALVADVAKSIRAALDPVPPWFDYYVLNHSMRIALDLEIIEKFLERDEPVAELGSSPLLLTASLTALGYQVTGIDVNPVEVQPAIDALKLRVLRCNIETGRLPFDDDSLSGVIFNEVFEHLRIDLVATVRELKRVLRPGARLLLSTPNGRSYSNLRNLILYDRGMDNPVYESYEALQTVGYMGHVREYTMSEVAEFLTAAGFVCTNAIFRGRYPTNAGQVVARLLPSLRPHFSLVAHKPR